MISWWSSYVGIPFKDLGRTRQACDCYGVGRLILKDRAGIELPLYGEISAEDLVAISGAVQAELEDAERWRPVDLGEQKPLDFVVMRRGHGSAKFSHLGIMVEPTKILHANQMLGSSCVRSLDHPTIEGRILTIVRHKDLP